MDVLNLASNMREDLRAPEIKDVNYETFTPTISTFTSVVAGIKQDGQQEVEFRFDDEALRLFVWLLLFGRRFCRSFADHLRNSAMSCLRFMLQQR